MPVPDSYMDRNLHKQIEDMMSYHPARSELDQPERYAALRNHFKELAHLVNTMCPNGRAKEKSLEALEVGLMRATQAIAVGEDV